MGEKPSLRDMPGSLGWLSVGPHVNRPLSALAARVGGGQEYDGQGHLVPR